MDVKLKFKEDIQLEVIESFDESTETVSSTNETFKQGEVIEAELVSKNDTIYEIQFGDGSVTYIDESDVEIVETQSKK